MGGLSTIPFSGGIFWNLSLGSGIRGKWWESLVNHWILRHHLVTAGICTIAGGHMDMSDSVGLLYDCNKYPPTPWVCGECPHMLTLNSPYPLTN